MADLQITPIFAQTVVQSSIAGLGGTVIDTLFGEPDEDADSNLAMIEMGGQLITMSFFNVFAGRLGRALLGDLSDNDPTGGLPFTMVFFSTQKNFLKKLEIATKPIADLIRGLSVKDVETEDNARVS